jgi:hypothetical protein
VSYESARVHILLTAYTLLQTRLPLALDHRPLWYLAQDADAVESGDAVRRARSQPAEHTGMLIQDIAPTPPLSSARSYSRYRSSCPRLEVGDYRGAGVGQGVAPHGVSWK